MKKLITLVVGLMMLTAVRAMAVTIHVPADQPTIQAVSVLVETKDVRPSTASYLRIFCTNDVPLAGLRIPLRIGANSDIIIDSVSFQYTIAVGNFRLQAQITNIDREGFINIIPVLASPVPTFPPPGGEICRIYFRVTTFAADAFVSVDTFYYPASHEELLASDALGIEIYPSFVSGGIQIRETGPRRTIHVPAEQPTIQAGINAASGGDTVLVAPGTYFENIRFYGKSVLLTSATGRAATFIQAADQFVPIVSFIDGEDSTSVIRGFAIRNVSNSYGIYCLTSHPIIEECEISSCSKEYADGAGIWCESSAPKIRNNVIHDNSFGNTGGGVGGTGAHGTRYWEITHNEIFNNYSPHGSGIGCWEAQYILIAYNLIRDNTSYAEQGAGIYVNGHHLMIRNNTIVGNQRGIRLLNGSNTDIRNNIVVSNLMEGLTPQSATFDYNNIYSNGSQNLLSTHGLSLDPLFIDTLVDNFHLSGASPCRDTGDPSSLYDDPDGSRNDMGAFYYVNTAPTGPTLVEPASTTTIPIATLRPQFVWRPSIDPDPYDTATYLLAIALDSNFTFVQQIPDLTDTSHTLTSDLQWGKQYWWNVVASDRNGAEVWSPQVFTFRTVTLGDCDNDAVVSVADVVFLIDYIFLGGLAPVTPITADANCDGHVNIGDAVYLIAYIFSHGPAPCSEF